MSKRKYWLLLFLPLLVFGLTACKDSHGKELKLSVSQHTAMLDENFQRTVDIKTNKDATYEVLKGDKVIQTSRKTKTGKAQFTFTEPGKYVVKAKSDNKHATKEQEVKILPCDVTINKTTSAVGPISFKVKHIKYEKVKKVKKSDLDKDAEINMEEYGNLNKTYYPVLVTYELINNGDQTIDTSTTTFDPVDDSGVTFSSEGGSDAYAFDTLMGSGKIQPHARRTGTVTMISNNHFTVKNMKFEVGEIWANDDDQIGDGGIATLN